MVALKDLNRQTLQPIDDHNHSIVVDVRQIGLCRHEDVGPQVALKIADSFHVIADSPNRHPESERIEIIYTKKVPTQTTHVFESTSLGLTLSLTSS